MKNKTRIDKGRYVVVYKVGDAVYFWEGHTTIMATNHNGNAIAERMMRYMNASFTITLRRYSEWERVLPLILFAYRTMVHDTTGFSPFYLMFGRDPILPLVFSWMPPSEREVRDPTYAEAQDYG